MKFLGPLMIALLALGCNAPQDPAAAPANADTTAAANPASSEPRALITTSEVDAAVKAMAGSYFIAAPNTDKNVTVKLHISEDGTADMYMYWAEGRTTEQLPGNASLKDGVLTIGTAKKSETFTITENGGLKYAGTRSDLEGIVLAKAPK